MSNACGLCETELTDGYLCPGCTLATARRLDNAPRWYVALAAFLQPAATGPSSGARGTRAEAPLPLAEPVLTLRGPGGIVSVLEDWRSAMQHDRPGWGEPVIEGDTARRIHVAARALSLNLEWIASSWPMAGDFASEIWSLERSVSSIVMPADPAERGKRVAYCVAAVPGGEVCGAVLRHRQGETRLVCPWCLYTYEAREFMMLRALQPEQAA